MKLTGFILLGALAIGMPLAAVAKDTAISATPQAASKVRGVDTTMVGTWTSVDANNGALHGVIVLKADKSASMQAQKGDKDLQTPLMTGTWQTKGDSLILTMPPYGTSTMKYALKGNTLRLTYENNNVQNFKRN